MISRERVLQIVRKEFRQALREPRMRVLLVGPPLIQLIVFGFAVNLDVDHVRLALLDRDRTPASRELVSRFAGSGRFRVVAEAASPAEIEALIDRGKAQAAVQVLPGFERDLLRGTTATVQIIIDGTNSNTAGLVSSYAAGIVNGFVAERLDERQRAELLARGVTAPAALRIPKVEAATRVWFNPDLRSQYYFVPGVLVNIVFIVTIMLTALAIVREKEIGTMEQLIVTPVRPLELMIGKTLPFAVVGCVQVTLITTAALLVFGVPLRGSVLLLFLGVVLFLLTTLGAGLFLSTVSHTQQQAMMSMFFFTMPAFMLSGFAFPIANMPLAIQWVTYLNPLRYFMEIVRGLFLKGTGLTVLWPQYVALAIFGVAVITMSAMRFRKKLD